MKRKFKALKDLQDYMRKMPEAECFEIIADKERTLPSEDMVELCGEKRMKAYFADNFMRPRASERIGFATPHYLAIQKQPRSGVRLEVRPDQKSPSYLPELSDLVIWRSGLGSVLKGQELENYVKALITDHNRFRDLCIELHWDFYLSTFAPYLSKKQIEGCKTGNL